MKLAARSTPTDRRALLFGLTALCGAVGFILRDFLLGDGETIPSYYLGDTTRYFVYLRDFASRELLQGNLPLWNPHSFSGTPFVGTFQSAVFYPLNAIYLALPVGRAIVLEFALHLLLLGFFVVLWLRGRGLHALAACFAALAVVFSGACLLRVLAGQLSVIDTIAWMPLVLLAVDRLAERGSLGWLITGVAAVSMMILAGHPPTLLMAGLTTALYCIPALVASRDRIHLTAWLLALGVLPIFLSAVQLWTGLQVAGEGLRQSGVSYEFATTFSFPPENLLTWFAPSFFGATVDSYVGRWFYWDASAYFGVVALALALHGALAGRGALRRDAAILATLLVVASLGRYTPVYQVLYEVVPGFAYLRSPSKFMFFATLFGAALVGVGVDQLLREAGKARRTALYTIAAAGLFGVLGVALWASTRELPLDVPARWLESLDGFAIVNPKHLARWNATLLQTTAVSVGLLATVSLLLRARSGGRWVVWIILAIGTLELLSFADANHGASPLWVARNRGAALVNLYARAGEDRVLEIDRTSNLSMHSGGYSLWGYDPVVLGRYSRFMAFTQGQTQFDLDNVAGERPKRFHRLFSMLRGKYQINTVGRTRERFDPLPRFLIVRDHGVVRDADIILDQLAAADFDPRQTVLLEEPPVPVPNGAGDQGRIQLLEESTDHLAFEVELETAGILIVTDAFSLGWTARALPGSVQSEYRVLPANLVLRAVPLAAGRHRFEMLYSPLAYRAGAFTSAISLVAWVGAALYCAHRAQRRAPSPVETVP